MIITVFCSSVALFSAIILNKARRNFAQFITRQPNVKIFLDHPGEISQACRFDLRRHIPYINSVALEQSGQTLSAGRIAGFTVGLVLFLVLLLNPLGLPREASAVAAVSALMASFWISVCIPIPVTSLFPIVLFPLLGIMESGQAVKYYSNDNIYLFMGGFVVALGIEKWGLHKRIALMIALFVGTSPKRLVLGFLCATAVISMLISNTATTMMMLPIAMGIITATFELSGQEDQNFAIALMLAVAYGASVGGIATPIGTPPNIIFLGQFREAFPGGPKLTFFDWGKVFLPLVAVFLPIVWIVLVRIVAPPRLKATAGREVIKRELAKLGPLRGPELRMSIVFALTVLLWVFRQPIRLEIFTIPGWSSVLGNPGFISDATVAIAMSVLLFLVPSGKKDGRGFLMDWRTAVRLPWGILLLFGGGFAIAGGFKVTGLDLIIGHGIRPLLNIHPLLVVALICLLITYLTELTSNTATTAALLPVMMGTALALKLNPLLLMIPATISASCAFMLPVATPPNAIVFGSGYVPMSKMVKGGMILNLVGVFIITMIVYFFVLPAWGVSTSIPLWASG